MMERKNRGNVDTMTVYRTEHDPACLLQSLTSIQKLADGDKESLGFLTASAYREAIKRRRLVAMLGSTNGNSKVVGFILYSGVFPNARIQQLVVDKKYRRAKIASALVNAIEGLSL